MITISWSSLRVWEQCHHRHMRARQGRAMQNPRNNRMFLPGTVADRVMRAWLEQDHPECGWMEQAVPEYMERYTNPVPGSQEAKDAGIIGWKNRDPVGDKRAVTEFVVEVVTKLEPFLMENVIPFRYQPELKFETVIRIPDLEGRLTSAKLIGGIDIVQQDEQDDFTLFDLKATSNPEYIRKVLGQGLFYDIAWGHYIGDQVQPKSFGFITPACKERVVYAGYTDDDRRAMMQRIIAYAHGIWRQDGTPSPHSGCTDCDAYHSCDAFAIAAYKDAAGRNRASFEETARLRQAARVSRTIS